MSKARIHIAIVFILTFVACAFAQAADFTAIATGADDYQIWRDGEHLFTIETRVIGPGWDRAMRSAVPEAKDGKRMLSKKVGFRNNKELEFDFDYEAFQSAPNRMVVKTRTVANKNAQCIGVMVQVSTTDFFSGGKGLSKQADGKEIAFDMPVGMSNQGLQMEEMHLTATDGTIVKIMSSRPIAVKSDRGELRIWAWSDEIKAGQPEETTLTFEFPGKLAFESKNRTVDMSNWFKFEPRHDFSPGSPVGAEDWLEAPAGKHGWVQMDGQNFVFEKKKEPFKFWGANIAYARMAVPDDEAIEWADKFAKIGVNIVRYHKWTGNGGWDGVMDTEDPLKFDEPRCQQFDRIHAEMKKRGIYAGWSPIFAPKLDESYAPHLDRFEELMAGNKKRKGRLFTNSLYPLSTFAPDVQDFYIALTCMWLNRTNTVTGKRYADDPAVAYVELHNEADIFFFGIGSLVKLYPSYEKYVNERFAGWLSKKYKDDEELKAAWGNGLKKNESLAKKNIFPFITYRGEMPAPQHVVDKYIFLYEYQNEFYDRYIEAIRKTGYKGCIVSGCWQAADMYGHLLNIAADRRAGFIDRHNYFKGERPMVAAPGSALLSAGMQQVADRPFGLTEWAGGHVWSAECQPVLGLIGLGLNGWDYSAQFASARSFVISDNYGEINGNFDELRASAQHPFIGRLLYSGNLKEGKVVGTRRISMEELYKGEVGFEESFSLLGGANLKTFAGSVPNQAMGAGRVQLEILDKPADVKVETFDLDKYWDRDNRIIKASNGQIVWDYSKRGYFTVDTPSGAAVIGFGGGKTHDLEGASVRYDNAFANVYVTARAPGETLANAKEIVILTLARTANEGELFDETDMSQLKRVSRQYTARAKPDQKIEMRNNPIMLVEPVKADITLKRKGSCKVYALDQDGCKPADAQAIPAKKTRDGVQFTLDGTTTKTMYYVVEF